MGGRHGGSDPEDCRRRPTTLETVPDAVLERVRKMEEEMAQVRRVMGACAELGEKKVLADRDAFEIQRAETTNPDLEKRVEDLVEQVAEMSRSSDPQQYLVQILGMAGLAETIAQAVFVSTLDNVTDFERIFFTVNAIGELYGEIHALIGLTRYAMKAWRSYRCPFSWREYPKDIQGLSPLEIIKVLARDPIHNLAYPPKGFFSQDEEASTTFFRVMRQGIALSAVAPAMIWASFILALANDVHHDAPLGRWLSGFFWVFTVATSATVFLFVRHAPALFIIVAWYLFTKAFAVYLLVARAGRLASGHAGEALLCLQLTEMMSCGIVLWMIGSNREYAGRVMR